METMSGPGLACPSCLVPIVSERPNAWSCPACGGAFEGLLGVPDLRPLGKATDPRDWETAQRLADDYDRRDFAGLLARLYELWPFPPSLAARQVQHVELGAERVGSWWDLLGRPCGPVLELGCGAGQVLAGLWTMGHRGGLAGADLAMRWLVLAKKRLDEAGAIGVPLACADAVQLPWPSETFTGAIAGDVLEHLADVDRSLAECHRVLAPQARLAMATPNRFSLAPEPHVRLLGAGWLPKRLAVPYVRWRRSVDFSDVTTRGANEWRRTFARSPFEGAELRCPPLPCAEARTFGPIKRGLARCHDLAVGTRLGQALAQRVGPMFQIVAERPGSTNRAIPPD